MRGLETDEFVLTLIPGDMPPSPQLGRDASAKMGEGAAGNDRGYYGRFRSVVDAAGRSVVVSFVHRDRALFPVSRRLDTVLRQTPLVAQIAPQRLRHAGLRGDPRIAFAGRQRQFSQSFLQQHMIARRG